MRDLKRLAFISGHNIIISVVILYLTHLHSLNVRTSITEQQINSIRNDDGLVEYKSIEFICSLYNFIGQTKDVEQVIK
jgi:hypothetical protein